MTYNECGFGPDEAAALVRRRLWTRRVILNAIFQTVVTSRTMLSLARREYKIRPGKVRLIQTGVDVSRFQPRRNEAGRAELGVGADIVLFGYLGGLRPEKNLGFLLRAFRAAELPNAKLVFAGDGPCRPELERLVAELSLADRVVFAGHQPDPVRYLSLLDVFVTSSTPKTDSNALVEAKQSIRRDAGYSSGASRSGGIAGMCSSAPG